MDLSAPSRPSDTPPNTPCKKHVFALKNSKHSLRLDSRTPQFTQIVANESFYILNTITAQLYKFFTSFRRCKPKFETQTSIATRMPVYRQGWLREARVVVGTRGSPASRHNSYHDWQPHTGWGLVMLNSKGCMARVKAVLPHNTIRITT